MFTLSSPVQLILLLAWVAVSNGQIRFVHDDDRTNSLSDADCVTPRRERGRCIRWTECPSLRRTSSWNRLQPYVCGFASNEPKVCCGLIPSGTLDRSDFIFTTTSTKRPARTPVGRNSGGKPSFLPDNCGVTRYPYSRVVGGQPAEKGSWPWMAVVFVEKRNGGTSPDCGGALVTTRHVITAAHCVVTGRSATTMSPRLLTVRLGAHDLKKNEPGAMDIGVDAVRRHEQFDPRTYKNDIAVLRLSRSVPFHDDVSPVCLPFDSLYNYNLTGKTSYVTGFGTTAFNSPLVVTPHRTLNSCRGVISESDLLCASETEILEGLSDQGVAQLSQTYAHAAKSSTLNNSTQTDENITKINCPPLKLLAPLSSKRKNIPTAVTTLSSAQTQLLPSISSKTSTTSDPQPPTPMSEKKEKIKEQPSPLHRPRKDIKKIDLLSIKPTTNLKKNPAKNTNLKTARSHTDDVKVIIRQYQSICVALQETFLKSCHTIKIRRYGCVRKDTEGPSVSGGVCIFTSLDVPSSALPLHTSFQAVAVRIHSPSLITVCCLYLPPNTVIHQHDLNNLVLEQPGQLEKPSHLRILIIVQTGPFSHSWL
ncbi:proclotting enzyme [Trichonephila clavipes]|nr:proclotting enzyme [Trichonephila clavipes]